MSRGGLKSNATLFSGLIFYVNYVREEVGQFVTLRPTGNREGRTASCPHMSGDRHYKDEMSKFLQ